jgi:hypothetical protein
MKMFLASAALLLAIFLLACNKDKFQTKPRIEIAGYNSKEIVPNDFLRLRINFFDKEGDLGDGTMTYIRVRTNSTPIPNPGANDKIDTIDNRAIPAFTPKSTGELNLAIDYGFLDEDPGRNDTMFFKIMVIDKAGNASDTISTELITARQN